MHLHTAKIATHNPHVCKGSRSTDVLVGERVPGTFSSPRGKSKYCVCGRRCQSVWSEVPAFDDAGTNICESKYGKAAAVMGDWSSWPLDGPCCSAWETIPVG